MKHADVKLLVMIVLAIALAGALWHFRNDLLPATDEPAVPQPEPVVEPAPAQSAPIHPVAPPPAEPVATDVVPLPPLDESDSYFLQALLDIFGADLELLLVNDALIDKFVATIDNLSRSHVAEKIRPVGRLSGTFAVVAAVDNGQYYLDPDNYARYDATVGLLSRADLELAAAMYRRSYPLFQESYERLGYPGAYFNDRVVEVIDHLLATPEADEPIRLVRPHVLYEFADPELEALSSGQKLLLRTGSEHAATIKRVLRNLRALIVQ